MTWPIDTTVWSDRLTLQTDRVSRDDAARQMDTVKEIVRRLDSQPGLVLADEVGMGKTFVALGVAVAAALADKGRRPVVVMVPSSLHEKWPRDFEVFRDLCLTREQDKAIIAKSAGSALEFFRFLDDDKRTRAHIIFLKHGAFHVSHIDNWVRLALLKRAMHNMHLGEKRTALPRFAAHLLRTKTSYKDPELYARLLHKPADQWRTLINEFYAGRRELHLDDDPIPRDVQKALLEDEIDLSELRECIKKLPARWSESIGDRLEGARHALNHALKRVWPQTLKQAKFRSPLLILDEAHHLKNPATRLASLFVEQDAEEDVDVVAGALKGAFERMLFLTATPFQLGHHELLNVLDRFGGIDWKSLPGSSCDELTCDLDRLRKSLDRAQLAGAELDKKWESLTRSDLLSPSGDEMSPEAWWQKVRKDKDEQPQRVQAVVRAYDMTQNAMKEAEKGLQKWVIRHLRVRNLPEVAIARRTRVVGQGIQLASDRRAVGLTIGGEAVLPFLLASRAQTVVSRRARNSSRGRATFAEGLASSYEAFLDTRRSREPNSVIDEEPVELDGTEVLTARYLEKLSQTLPEPSAYGRHPKVSALVERVVDLWAKGEKVVVFCHFRQTGRALVRHLSAGIERRLWQNACNRLNLPPEEARRAVEAFGDRFDDGEAMQRALEAVIEKKLRAYKSLSAAECSSVQDVVRRFIRTPLFVARFFDVSARSSPALLDAALKVTDLSGVSLGDKIDGFLYFIAERCRESERAAYLDALNRVQPGSRGERPLDADDISTGDVDLLPNVRLANGGVKAETRGRLMLSFNTPFFPEVLVASSVLAEGVDLHLNCRYLIHYDLSWNPSTLEQRTGRIDRLGAKAEQVKKPIEVFLPYLAATQDEKQYRVVMDRERWFQVLMGEDYKTDEAATDKMAERVPLPESAASALAFDLAVGHQ